MDFATVLPDGDALAGTLNAGAELGLLGIELATRRRNRVNGTISETRSGGFSLDVGQTFGNCPQHISERYWHSAEADAPRDSGSERGHELSTAMQDWIRAADTFFIGSGFRDEADSRANGLDASHRGGPVGFVEVVSPTRILFPDYAGNNHFNTIGNLLVDPRVGLLFVDFAAGSLLQLTGRATIDWDSEAVDRHAGAQRLVIVDIDEIVLQESILPIRFSDASATLRELRLVARRQESDDVVSFYFGPGNDGELADFSAGQHLPIELDIDELSAPVARSYSLSNGPGENVYRISVKRESRGLVSRYLHDSLHVGSVIKSHTPTGDFVLPPGDGAIVLISAGIGVTPMLSMLHELAADESSRPVVFIHGARNSRLHPLSGEVRMIAQKHLNVKTRIAYSQPLEADQIGEHYDLAGRVDRSLIQAAVGDLDADYFLCGPAPFLGAMSDILSELGVDDTRVHVEQF